MKLVLTIAALTSLTAWQAYAGMGTYRLGAGGADYNVDGTPDIGGVALTTTGTAPWLPSTRYSGYLALTPSGDENNDHWYPLGYENFVSTIDSTITVLANGFYSFGTYSDDGSALYIDGNLVVNNGGEHSPQDRFANAFLTAGNHELFVTFYEGDPLGQANLTAYVGPGVRTPDGGGSMALMALGCVGLAGVRRKLVG